MEKTMRDIDKLLWIFNFINQDIDSLKTGDFLKIYSEFREYFMAQIITFAKFTLTIPFDPQVEGIKKPLKNIAVIADNKESREEVKTHQKQLRDFIEYIYMENINDGSLDLKFVTNTMAHIRRNKIVLIKSSKYEDPSKKYTPIILELMELIYNCSPKYPKEKSGLFRHLKNLKKCQAPGCNNFFWQAHKKEKNFCSNKCAMRAYVKAKREVEKETKEIGNRPEEAAYEELEGRVPASNIRPKKKSLPGGPKERKNKKHGDFS